MHFCTAEMLMLMFGDSEIRNKVVETVGQQLTHSRQICVKTAPRRLVLVLNMIKLSVDNNTFVCTVDRSTIKLKYFSSLSNFSQKWVKVGLGSIESRILRARRASSGQKLERLVEQARG